MILTVYSFHRYSIINLFLFIFFIISFIGCSSSKRFNDEDYNYPSKSNINSPNISVLLDDNNTTQSITLESNVILYSAEKSLAIINSGNKIITKADGENIFINIGDKNFTSEYFKLGTKDKNSVIKYNDKKYRGFLKLLSDGNKILVVNELPLEDYLRGVLPLEMPIGQGDENYEALKSMAVAARTYSLSKMNKKK